jgi:hypothetical protein
MDLILALPGIKAMWMMSSSSMSVVATAMVSDHTRTFPCALPGVDLTCGEARKLVISVEYAVVIINTPQKLN